MEIDLMPLLQAILGVVSILITTKLIPWLKANATAKQQLVIGTAVSTAVYAAEQVYGAGKGAEKMDYVVQYMAGKGYKIDRTEIEAAVKEMNLGNQFIDLAKG